MAFQPNLDAGDLSEIMAQSFPGESRVGIFLVSQCHPSSPVWAYYIESTSAIELSCAECDAYICTLPIGRKPESVAEPQAIGFDAMPVIRAKVFNGKSDVEVVPFGIVGGGTHLKSRIVGRESSVVLINRKQVDPRDIDKFDQVVAAFMRPSVTEY